MNMHTLYSCNKFCINERKFFEKYLLSEKVLSGKTSVGENSYQENLCGVNSGGNVP